MNTPQANKKYTTCQKCSPIGIIGTSASILATLSAFGASFYSEHKNLNSSDAAGLISSATVLGLLLGGLGSSIYFVIKKHCHRRESNNTNNNNFQLDSPEITKSVSSVSISIPDNQIPPPPPLCTGYPKVTILPPPPLPSPLNKKLDEVDGMHRFYSIDQEEYFDALEDCNREQTQTEEVIEETEEEEEVIEETEEEEEEVIEETEEEEEEEVISLQQLIKTYAKTGTAWGIKAGVTCGAGCGMTVLSLIKTDEEHGTISKAFSTAMGSVVGGVIGAAVGASVGSVIGFIAYSLKKPCEKICPETQKEDIIKIKIRKETITIPKRKIKRQVKRQVKNIATSILEQSIETTLSNVK